jgi:ABC-2 type transport system ATP-binding protein
VVLAGGRIAAAGSPAELKRTVGTSTVMAQLRDERDTLTAASLLAAAGRRFDVDDRTHRIRIPAANGLDDLTWLIGALTAKGLPADDIGIHPPTLDDVFFALAGPARKG